MKFIKLLITNIYFILIKIKNIKVKFILLLILSTNYGGACINLFLCGLCWSVF